MRDLFCNNPKKKKMKIIYYIGKYNDTSRTKSI